MMCYFHHQNLIFAQTPCSSTPPHPSDTSINTFDPVAKVRKNSQLDVRKRLQPHSLRGRSLAPSVVYLLYLPTPLAL
ncbi:hypothetical protein CPB84DRAFT_1778701 [Gymnopilus junonius]|uniref:Uncharacterized protein n=1 Tax=Gymnopilus junonius TaxID=109634 RepID=A0A9P5TND1_GYMJU|nr:hypothetical protein CPB84DRAFT_1778701 [Gymnopilus junonius]